MKFIQSCWSCNQINFLQFNAGWCAPEYNLMSWALSALQLNQFYNSVVLYADNASAKILIDTLQLPYAQVVCELDKLNSFNPKLWALAKIYAYSKQEQPFLHVDSDVFIWQPFDGDLLNRGLIAQNLEVSTDYYENVMKNLEKNLEFLPKEIIEDRKSSHIIYAYNAGILGGCDIKFFKEFTQKSLKFVEMNNEALPRINIGTFNIFFEQYLFYCLAKTLEKKVGVLFPDIIGDNEYVGFDDFIEVPYNKKYLHLLGTYKRNKNVCEQMANRLRHDYPEYYYRIIALFKDKRIPLLKDYYYQTGNTDEKSLVSRYERIKMSFKANQLTVNGNDIVKGTAKQSSRGKAIKEFIESGQNHQGENNIPKLYKHVLKDVVSFERKLTDVVLKKNATYSYEYLYGRDINGADYHRYVFENSENMYEKKLVADKLTSIIKSHFEWSKIDPDNIRVADLVKVLKCKPSNTYTAVVPEPNEYGFSLSNIDTLDLFLLDILKTPKKIAKVLDTAKSAFDPDELRESELEFESLIIGRLKNGLKIKTIKAIIG